MQSSIYNNNETKSSGSRYWPQTPITKVDVPEYFQHKLVAMRILGMGLLVVFLPLMLVCMALVRLTSQGPVIYRQTRLGKGQRPFQIYKIRTMYDDCENISGPALCCPGDSRVTPIGRVLRFLHLDELPQLINVARGEMCLVGPRPERPEIIERNKLKEIVPGFDERTKVLPGVTGLAQINLPADQSPECVIPKVQLDLGYIETATLQLDFRILLCTALRMAGVRHGRAVRLLGLIRKVHLADIVAAPAFGKVRLPSGASMMEKRTVNLSAAAQSVVRPPRLAVAVSDNSVGMTADWEEAFEEFDTGHPRQPK